MRPSCDAFCINSTKLEVSVFPVWFTSPFQTFKPAHVLHFTNLFQGMLLLRRPPGREHAPHLNAPEQSVQIH